jgi:hypothetical protein
MQVKNLYQSHAITITYTLLLLIVNESIISILSN